LFFFFVLFDLVALEVSQSLLAYFHKHATHMAPGVQVGAFLPQPLNHRQVALVCCRHQRRPAFLRTRNRTA
jgi:hypothetical protein